MRACPAQSPARALCAERRCWLMRDGVKRGRELGLALRGRVRCDTHHVFSKCSVP